jgi:uncharacterized membrane protein
MIMKYAYSSLYLSLLSLVFALVLMAPGALAYTDVGIDVHTRVNATCPCSTLTPDDINVFITNLGTSRETYELSLNLPDGGDWSGFISPAITLSPKEQGSAAAIYITPSCSVEAGTYNMSVVVRSGISDKEFVRGFEIDVLPCHQLSIELKEYEFCEGIESSSEITIKNNGISDEKLRVAASEDWITLSVSDIEIGKGEEETIEVIFSPPDDEAGMKNVTISVESLTSYARSEKTILANVRDCYATGISIDPVRLDVCPCKTGDFLLTINNTGLMDDTYVVMYEKQSREVDISAGETEEVEVSVDIPCDKEQGDYPVLITVDSYTPGKTEVILGVMPLNECYTVSLSSDNTSQTVAVGKAVTYTLTIKNNGEFKQVYELLMDAPDWVHLSESRAELEAGEEKEIYLYAAPSYYIQAGEYIAAASVVSEIEQAGIEFKVIVLSDFPFAAGVNESVTSTSENLSEANVTMKISIPTGELISAEGGAVEDDGSWTQIMLLTILALGVVIILILKNNKDNLT